MAKYVYRLTITWSSGSQWKIGVETLQIGEDLARELAPGLRAAGDFQNICLSEEKTGKVHWLKTPQQMGN